MVVWVQCADVASKLIELYPDFPSALTTGPQSGVTLSVYGGSNVLSTDNQVFENWIVTGSLIVTAKNVTIRNCKVVNLANDAFIIIDVRDGADNCIIEYCYVQGPGVNGPCSSTISGGNGAGVGNITVRYCNISQGEHGIVLGNGPATIIGNYLHDPDIDPTQVGGDKHVGGVSMKGGQNGVVVHQNTIIATHDATSCVFMQAQFGTISNVTVDNNRLDIDPGFNLYLEDRFGFQTTNITISNNVLYQGQFGYFSIIDNISPPPTIFGNVFLPGAPAQPILNQTLIDGSANVAGSSGTSVNVGPITSTKGNGKVVIFILNDLSSGSAGGPNDVTSITGGGLTFSLRALVSNASGKDIQEWTAQVGGAALSAVTFTVNYGASSNFTSISAFVMSSVTGSVVGFDPGGPRTGTVSPFISTGKNISMVVGAARYSATSAPTAGSSGTMVWTGIMDGVTGSFLNSEYRQMLSNGVYTPVYAAGDGTAFITDAFYGAP